MFWMQLSVGFHLNKLLTHGMSANAVAMPPLLFTGFFIIQIGIETSE